MVDEAGWYLHKLRVRYQETDRMGVVYHANYLNWFEIGRTEWVRRKGWSYRKLEEQGLRLPVIDAEMHFRKPAYYDDIVRIYTRLAEMSRLQLVFEVEIRRAGERDTEEGGGGPAIPEGELLVRGRTRHAWLDASWKPVRLDRQHPDLFESLNR